MSAVRIAYILSLCTFASSLSKSSAISPTSPTATSPTSPVASSPTFLTAFSLTSPVASSPIPSTTSSLTTHPVFLPTPASTITSRAGVHRGYVEFYKMVEWAWHLKETPHADYTWTDYIDNHLKMGIRNFVLGHITITESRIEFGGGARMRREWEETSAFMYLRRNVIAKGGRILVDIKATDFHHTAFNETVFREEVDTFMRDFPVDGFRILANLENKYSGIPGYKSEREYFGSMKALL
ncbi:hypothetical protein FOZ60_002937 [Perkinsus olseni]|uniref:Uncharacterized protein n=1 Tax=Perkinsus olseni TaxID=32597 RepID=A0A7J6NWN0_PEROL|nr:hypothetical protein FOZ60_002937 [Perkinsus olseni]